MKLVSLKTDHAFKEVFSHENVGKQFLSEVLGIPLEDIRAVRVANPHLPGRYHTRYTLRSEDGVEYPDLFEIHTIELGKELNGNDAVDDWIRLFNAESEEDLAMIGRKSLGMGEAMSALRELSLGRKLRCAFEARLKAKRDRWAEDEFVRDEGIAIGRAEGRAEAILGLLCDVGDIPGGLRKRIMDQKDLNALSRWHRLAARSRTVEEFESAVSEEREQTLNAP